MVEGIFCLSQNATKRDISLWAADFEFFLAMETIPMLLRRICDSKRGLKLSPSKSHFMTDIISPSSSCRLAGEHEELNGL